jgi:hypothetical protein
MDRHARQRLLAAVGDAGQDRIASATYTVASDAAASVARDYLARAGAERFELASKPLEPFAHAAAFRHAAARDLAEGAWRALGQLRLALEKAP